MKVKDYNTLNKQKVRTVGVKDDTISMGFGKAAQGMLFTMFTEDIYKNVIGSICREIASNCFDAHIKANNESPNNPVFIKKTHDKVTNTHYISFIDNGTGMSPEMVENIYAMYFESTKRDNNDEIGGFGIGGKTPLAYKRKTTQEDGKVVEDSSFFVITRYNGIEYKYLVYIGSNSPKIKPMGEESTKKANGTEVRIPVLVKDLDKFELELNRQLYYFENIVFQGFNTDDKLNSYKVYKGEHFLYRGDNYEEGVHVCLGKVAYKLDFSNLGISEWDNRIPVGLKFDIGDIKVTPNREDLQYNEDTINTILEKIELAKDEIREMIGRQYDNVQTLEQYYAVKENFGHLEFDNMDKLYVGKWVSKSNIDFSNFKYNELPYIPDSQDVVKHFYNVHQYGKTRSTYAIGINCFYGDNAKVYKCAGDFQRKIIKQSYLNHIHDKNYVILKPYMDVDDMFADDSKAWERLRLAFGVSKEEGGWNSSDIVDKMDLKKGKSLLKKFRKDVMTWINKNVTSYDSLDVPQDFIDARKQERLSKEILKTTIPVKDAQRWGSRGRVKVEALVNFKGRIFWGVTDEDHKVREGREMYSSLFGTDRIDGIYDYHNKFHKGQGIIFLTVSKANAKYMKMSDKAYHIDTIFPTLLRRKIVNPTDIKVANNYIDRYNNLNGLYRNKSFKDVNAVVAKYRKEVKEEVKTLKPYRDYESIDFNSELVAKYFDASKAGTLRIATERQMNYLYEVQDKNIDKIKWINIPYYAEDEDFTEGRYSGLVELLKKVMVF